MFPTFRYDHTYGYHAQRYSCPLLFPASPPEKPAIWMSFPNSSPLLLFISILLEHHPGCCRCPVRIEHANRVSARRPPGAICDHDQHFPCILASDTHRLAIDHELGLLREARTHKRDLEHAISL